MENNSCYICLENTNTYIIANVCNCKIYSHEACYINWLRHTNNCMICKRIISHYDDINISIEKFYLKKTIEIPIISLYFEFMNGIFGNIIEFILKKCQSLIGFILLFAFSMIMLIFVIIPLVLIVSFRVIFHIIKNKIQGNLIDKQNYKIFYM